MNKLHRLFVAFFLTTFFRVRRKSIVCLGLTFVLAFVSHLRAADSVVAGKVRVQCLSDSLVRLELEGPHGFEDRPTFHVVNRDWEGAEFTTNLVSGELLVAAKEYVVHVPVDATSLSSVYVTDGDGRNLYRFDGSLKNSVWLPGPAEKPAVWSFADSPRLVPPAWGTTPAPDGADLLANNGWDVGNDSADIYVFVPGGSYTRLRSDFLKLTGRSEMIPLWAFGCWDSRWYDYNEETALAQIDEYRARNIPLDAFVCDTGWRVNASTGYAPNTNLFPDMARFFAEAHAKNVHVMFNDHPEPVGAFALDPQEVIFRYTNLVQLSVQGLDVWWYDRNWSASIHSPASNLRKEVWGMKIYQDEAMRARPSMRPLMMANVDGVDNGRRNHAPEVAAHRYSIQWTGDIGPGNDYLNFAVRNAVHAGVQAVFPYESDDLGGHTSDPSPEKYIRWIEYGAFSPIYRPHCTYNLMRMPWAFGVEAEWVTRRLLNLRYRLLPEFYAAARNNYDTGEPILRRLDLDYPQYAEATRENQYLIGHSLLVAPVLENEYKAVPSAWFTTTNGDPGLNGSYFNNTNLTGVPSLSRTDAAIDFNWGKGSPGHAVNNDYFTARWIGNLTIPASAGEVRLCATSDDGVRVWVDDKLCIDNWGPNDSVTVESPVTLKPGRPYHLRVEYLELTADAIISLKYHANPAQPVWIPPGNWVNAWTGELVQGPLITDEKAPLDQIPLFIRSGSIFALAPEMQYTGQKPWSPVMLDVYPDIKESGQTILYEDDTLTTAYKQGQFRKTEIKTWTDDTAKAVSISIGAAMGSYSNALTERSWVARFRCPVNWPADMAVTSVTLNGQPIGPVIRRVKNNSAMPLGADNGAPDADVFEITVPATTVLNSNILVASFTPSASPWSCGDIGMAGANGGAQEGSSTISNSVFFVRSAGNRVTVTNDRIHFLFQPCHDNFQVTVKLNSQSATNVAAQAGLMIRESMDPGARNVVLATAPDGHVVISSRAANNQGSEASASADLSGSCWLRLERDRDTFTGSTSSDGITWKMLGSVTVSSFNLKTCTGLVAATGTSGTDITNYNTAAFSNLALTKPTDAPPMVKQENASEH